MSDENKNLELKLELFENGVDFILKGIDELFTPDNILKSDIGSQDRANISYKYGTLHLFSGFLLLLKERLRLHLEELIYVGRINVTREKLFNNNPPGKTVDLDEALERLQIGPKVEFTDDEIKIIRKMQDYRNRFEHYRVSANQEALWDSIVDFLALIERFLVHHLNEPLESLTDEYQLINRIRSIDKVWEQIESRKKRDWEEKITKKAKSFRRQRKEILQSLRSDEREGETIFTFCPDCLNETLISSGDFSGICSNQKCRNLAPINNCTNCGQPAIGHYWDEPWCEDCKGYFYHYMEKDD